jgi:transposase
MENGYIWGPIGERISRVGDCPSLLDRINWYGAYNFSDGECLIWAEGACNKEWPAQFLVRIKEWIKAADRRVVVVWDGAPWHRAKMVTAAAEIIGIEIVALPGYSPNLNPIEGLWKWMREEVTKGCCYTSMKSLFDACKKFIDTINRQPHCGPGCSQEVLFLSGVDQLAKYLIVG